MKQKLSTTPSSPAKAGVRCTKGLALMTTRHLPSPSSLVRHTYESCLPGACWTLPPVAKNKLWQKTKQAGLCDAVRSCSMLSSPGD